MGVSIDLHEYNFNELYNRITEITKGKVPEGRSVNEFFTKVLPKFGIRYGDSFVVLWNEYYEEYNSGSELMQAASLYFGIPDMWLGGYRYRDANMNAYEVLEDLGIEPIYIEEEV
jgi:Fe-S oxidoreductase